MRKGAKKYTLSIQISIPGKRKRKHWNVTVPKQALSLEIVILCLWLFMMIIYSLMDKAKALETLLEEEEHDVRETKKPSRNVDRSGALRKVGSDS